MEIRVPAKQVRAEEIACYVTEAGYRGVVCFSCGNASRALREIGLYVVDVSPSGDLEARRWWTPAEIHKAWPDLFDATSGHLPGTIMVRLAARYRTILGELQDGVEYDVPTGSGETIACLRWAYPRVSFHPRYGGAASIRYEPQAPLTAMVNEWKEHKFDGLL